MNRKGQAVLLEYVMMFFAVVGMLAAITIFVQRGLQARLHDARHFMISSLVTSGACDINCQQAAGGNLTDEYEPYYVRTISDVSRNEAKNEYETPSLVNWSIGTVYTRSVNATTSAISASSQLPPECADGANPRPSYCGSIAANGG